MEINIDQLIDDITLYILVQLVVVVENRKKKKSLEFGNNKEILLKRFKCAGSPLQQQIMNEKSGMDNCNFINKYMNKVNFDQIKSNAFKQQLMTYEKKIRIFLSFHF